MVLELGHPVAVGRLTIHSLEDVGAGIAAAAVHTRRLKAKSCNFSSYLSLPSRGERDWLRSSRERGSHSCRAKSLLGFCQPVIQSLLGSGCSQRTEVVLKLCCHRSHCGYASASSLSISGTPRRSA